MPRVTDPLDRRQSRCLIRLQSIVSICATDTVDRCFIANFKSGSSFLAGVCRKEQTLLRRRDRFNFDRTYRLTHGFKPLRTEGGNNMAKYGKKASEKVEKAMHERNEGTLKSGRSGKKVTSKKQAIAIGLSEARKAGAKVPRKKSSSKN